MPWREKPTPYNVLVSELMLQQTTVATVIPHYHRFMSRFPDIKTLAKATEDEVLSYWQGLGYYSRARNLLKTAKFVIENHNGKLPELESELLALPGVGPYTSAAIAAFAYNVPTIAFDTNIKRVVQRLAGVAEFSNQFANNCKHTLAHQTLSGVFNTALMDYGSRVCKAKNPLCGECVLQSYCKAFQFNRVDKIPYKPIKKIIPTKYTNVFFFLKEKTIAIQKRAGKGLLASMYQFPATDFSDFEEKLPFGKLLGHYNHTFSHFKLQVNVWLVNELPNQVQQSTITFVEFDDLGNYAIPTAFKKALRYLDIKMLQKVA